VQWDEREDDEISIKLRELQAKLREQSKRNNYRKQILIEKVKAQIGWQQYQSYLETLDTQIEEAYLARFVSNFFFTIYVYTRIYRLIVLSNFFSLKRISQKLQRLRKTKSRRRYFQKSSHYLINVKSWLKGLVLLLLQKNILSLLVNYFSTKKRSQNCSIFRSDYIIGPCIRKYI
jgi:hypothetical protein